MKKSVVVHQCAQKLMKHQLTLAFAESMTAGCLCNEFGLIPGCGSFFKGGIIAYNADIKKKLLGLTQAKLNKFTPESAEVTREMALGLQVIIPADCIVACTGLNTPGGSEEERKPVGTVFVHAIVQQREYAIRKRFNGSPDSVNKQVVLEVCKLLMDAIGR